MTTDVPRRGHAAAAHDAKGEAAIPDDPGEEGRLGQGRLAEPFQWFARNSPRLRNG